MTQSRLVQPCPHTLPSPCANNKGIGDMRASPSVLNGKSRVEPLATDMSASTLMSTSLSHHRLDAAGWSSFPREYEQTRALHTSVAYTVDGSYRRLLDPGCLLKATCFLSTWPWPGKLGTVWRPAHGKQAAETNANTA